MGGGAAEAAALARLSGGRGAHWTGGGGRGPAGAAPRGGQRGTARLRSRMHLPGGLAAEAAPVQQPHLAEEDAVDEGHGGELLQLQLHAELELLLLHHDEGHGPCRGPPPRQLRCAPATPLRSAPMPGARAAPRAGPERGRCQLSPAGRGAPGQRLHGSRRLPFKPARLRSARCRRWRPQPLASAAAKASTPPGGFPEKLARPGAGVMPCSIGRSPRRQRRGRAALVRLPRLAGTPQGRGRVPGAEPPVLLAAPRLESSNVAKHH